MAALGVTFSAAADEGMWMLPYLQKMNIKTMKERGCKLSAEQIYSLNKSSLKDAIVIFGGGCTGEIVSPEGLLFTNHHCGFGSIQELSSVEHDYLKNGFWARSRAEELPAPGLKVRFIRQIVDVTGEVLGSVPSISDGEERLKIVKENIDVVQKRMREENPGMVIEVVSFFGGNQFFAFIQEVFTDVRLVGAPPTSIGKFGGETDNWMWPRHTGDFSVFRVYANKENKPAEYSADNQPYKADKFLKVSVAGVKEKDFAMIMGFPGSTERYMTSYEIDRMLSIANPQRIFIRGERQDILKKAMAASDLVRIQYAAKYASSSNYWKNSIGMSRGIEKLDVKERKRAQEAEFMAWAEANTLPEEGYIDALEKIRMAMEVNAPFFASEQYLKEAIGRSIELLIPARAAYGRRGGDDAVTKRLQNFYKDYDETTDRAVAKRMIQIVYEHCEKLPTIFTEIEQKFKGDTDAYVDYLYNNSIFSNAQKAMKESVKLTKEELAADPAVVFARSLDSKLRELSTAQKENERQFADGHRLYVAGLMKMQPEKAWAPDANFTIRLTYGRVLPYTPADGIRYNHYTTLKGVIEKENPANPVDFTVPAKLKELYAARDFGRYANAKGELPVAFLADCDITGGNSGSPMLNARGELIGLAFDGNWEAMSGDVAFEPELQRTIGVDVRYVLFIIDKFAGAGWLLDEMQIVEK